MAVFDFDGAVCCEIKNVLDFDGTALHPIAAVYDADGAALHPVYSGETVLYDGGKTVPFEGVTRTDNSSYVYAYADDGESELSGRVHYNLAGGAFYAAEASWRTAEALDLSQFSTVTVRARVHTAWSSYNGVRLEFWNAAGSSVGSISLQQDLPNVTTDSEWTLSLAAFAGVYKIGLTAWQTYSDGRGAEFHLFKFSLS